MHVLRKTLFSVVALAGAMPAQANTINVTDTGAGSAGTCTLAQAIYAANLANNPNNQTPVGATTIAPLSNSATTSVGSCANASAGTNVIRLPSAASIDFSTDAPDNFWYGPNALPPIASTIVIEGNGAALNVVIGSSPRLRFFFVGANPQSAATPGYNTPGAGNLTLHNLTLSGGRQNGGNSDKGGGGAGMGGAIYNQGALTLNAVTLSANRAVGGESGSYSAGATGGGMGGNFGMGGAVPQGTGEAGHDGNVAAGTGGAGGGIPNGMAGSGGSGQSEFGGVGIGGVGGDGGGGGCASGPNSEYYNSGGGGGFGGGLGGYGSSSSGWFNATGGGFGKSGSENTGGGGGVGAGGAGYTDCYVGGGGGFGGGGGASIVWSAGSGGFGGGGGNGVGSVGGFGGGAGYPSSAGAGAGGAGAGFGGAIFNHAGAVNLINSTLTGNMATGGRSDVSGETGGYGGAGLGGAVFNLNGAVTVNFCTLAGNFVAAGYGDQGNGGAGGGAIYSLAYNGAASTGSSNASLTLTNSILANSNGGNDLVVDQPARVGGGWFNAASATTTALGANLVMTSNSYNAALPSFPVTADPQLGALADNGGPTKTMALQAGSPAIDMGNACTSANPFVDQRGYERSVGARPDLGAYEAGAQPSDVIFRNPFELPPGC